VIVTILIATGLTAAAYFIYRKRQKEKFAGIFQNLLISRFNKNIIKYNCGLLLAITKST